MAIVGRTGAGKSTLASLLLRSYDPDEGAVLLDGQLVGQWLWDRMARDAERPPAGLTGFDVRRAPAWSVG